AKRQRDGNQMDARPERSGIRCLSDHPCSTASRIRNVMSTVTSKSVGAPESSTFPPARTRSQRVMSAIVAAARARTTLTASSIESGELPVNRIVLVITLPPRSQGTPPGERPPFFGRGPSDSPFFGSQPSETEGCEPKKPSDRLLRSKEHLEQTFDSMGADAPRAALRRTPLPFQLLVP